MYCLKYAPNGRNSIRGKLADVTQNCHSLKLISLLKFLKFFAAFSAISLKIDELKALNTAKIWEILNEKCVGMIDNFAWRLQVCL